MKENDARNARLDFPESPGHPGASKEITQGAVSIGSEWPTAGGTLLDESAVDVLLEDIDPEASHDPDLVQVSTEQVTSFDEVIESKIIPVPPALAPSFANVLGRLSDRPRPRVRIYRDSLLQDAFEVYTSKISEAQMAQIDKSGGAAFGRRRRVEANPADIALPASPSDSENDSDVSFGKPRGRLIHSYYYPKEQRDSEKARFGRRSNGGSAVGV
ncbi:hypothetical protein NMY22_g17935 [Coprinellus aureogranulatus]|nr:hypothetical protein NMY22_g17935 [Coprinellus aureogranulatus]